MIAFVWFSFHVGSGCHEPSSYHAAVDQAKMVFDYAEKLGFQLKLLDLGGGYPGIWEEMKDFEMV
jgi:ornithine decarboxylase